MNIAIVFDKMLWGGIERVGISYIELLKEMGFSVDVYILNEREIEDIVCEIPKDVSVYKCYFVNSMCPEGVWGSALEHDWKGFEKMYFGLKYIYKSFSSRLCKIKIGSCKNYDVAIAFSGHLNDLTFVSGQFIKSKYQIGWLHGSQSSYNMYSPGFFQLYKKIKNLVCLSEYGDAECLDFNRRFHINKYKLYNPIVKKNAVNKSVVNQLIKQYGDFCIMVGRLAEDKDQETLIRSIAYLKKNYGWDKKVLLLGSGSKYDYIKRYIEERHLSDLVILEGNKANIQDYYSATKILIHSSILEGLPTVVLEAMSYGVPVVATEGIPGIPEILGNNRYGLVSANYDEIALAENIRLLMTNQDLYECYARSGYERVKDFEPSVIKTQFKNVLRDIMIQ